MPKKKSLNALSGSFKTLPSWDSLLNEPWLLEFEKQRINEENWSCLVTSGIQAKDEDEVCIKLYKQTLASGSRKPVKIISKSDIMNLLREFISPTSKELNIKTRPPGVKRKKKVEEKQKEEKQEEAEKAEKGEGTLKSSVFFKIQNLMLKYVKLNEPEKLDIPPNLMAVLIKYMILNLKQENINEKQIKVVKKKKVRERELKWKFIRDLKPFEVVNNPPKVKVPENEHPIDGPDLYIMLTDLFDLSCYAKLLKMNVPFVAFLKIENPQMEPNNSSSILASNIDQSVSLSVITEFWKNLENPFTTDKDAQSLKNTAVIYYTLSTTIRKEDLNDTNKKLIIDELSWVQYSTYRIYYQYQQFIQQFQVQKVNVSLEPLDLSQCDVYNKLCDALITGQSLTPLFILYAMIEQLVVGIPETESIKSDFDIDFTDFFPHASKTTWNFSEKNSSEKGTVELVTPCVQCRDKPNYYAKVCKKFLEKTESSSESEIKASENNTDLSSSSFLSPESNPSNATLCSDNTKISISLIDQVLSERKSEKELRREKKWRAPKLCFYGDLITLETYHCDPRIIDSQTLFDRFFKNSDLLRIWGKYPELSPEKRAYYNFHYNSLLKISQESDEVLKTKIFFSLLMKLSSMSKAYFFRGPDTNVSEKLSTEIKIKKNASKVNSRFVKDSGNRNDFSNFFLKTFIWNAYSNSDKNREIRIDERNSLDSDDGLDTHDDSALRKVGAVTFTRRNFLTLGSLVELTGRIQQDNKYSVLASILDCADFSLLSDFESERKKEDFPHLVQGFRYYENLKPSLMIQRLLQCRRFYNTLHCTYFPPTDSLVIHLHNDTDHRGIFYQLKIGKLRTPVALRDFHKHLIRELKEWIFEEVSEDFQLISENLEKEKALEEKMDEDYLLQLKEYYCSLDEKGRKEFLEQEIDLNSEPEVLDGELSDLPPKIKLENSKKTIFTGFDFKGRIVETYEKHHEFYSRDGTEVHAYSNSWLYEGSELLSIKIKRTELCLCYFWYFPSEVADSVFTVKTQSDITFLFFKERGKLAENNRNFNVRMTWPTGLLVEVKSIQNFPNEIFPMKYIKQSYLQACRKDWEIEDEKSRSYLKNGQVLIFKVTGDVKILTGSGTIHNLYYGERARCETITMTGAVWEQRIGKTRCRNKRKISTLKVYIGVDRKTQETYYKRDDGASCMLWPNGKLVTTYPDGTKITSIPEFDHMVMLDWTEEEAEYFFQLELKQAGMFEQKSRAILRNSSTRSTPRKSVVFNEFMCVSCSYLMEHPKYSAVYCNPKKPLIEIRTLEMLTMKCFNEGGFAVEKHNESVTVTENSVEFDTLCNSCGKSSTALLDFDSETLCECVDFFQNKFMVYRNGITSLLESPEVSKIPSDVEPAKTTTNLWCQRQHTLTAGAKQRCFILERDLSGIELVHSENLTSTDHYVLDNTCFDLNTGNPEELNHTFCTPLTKVGYENWVMEYEKDDSLPVNLKKKDLRELDVKENRNKLFQYPFPNGCNLGKIQSSQPAKKIKMPKVNLVRIIRCLSLNPMNVIDEMSSYVAEYQKRAHQICQDYRNRGVLEAAYDDRHVDMRLKKVAVTLSQNLKLYPFLCTEVPSTETDIHYFGHLINSAEDLKSHFTDASDLPNCKQIPRRLPVKKDFPSILEENETANV